MVERYPDKLLEWAGHRDGGVKKPFAVDSGRPTGQIIETQITKRLRDWVINLSQGTIQNPSAIFLIGGPGNGKTDAIESIVEFFGKSLGIGTNLTDAIKAKYQVELPPRKLIIHLGDFVNESHPFHSRDLVIVQDATEGEIGIADKSPESLFLDDIEELLNADEDQRPIYLCGINRGILAHAVLIGDIEDRSAETLNFTSVLTQAATSNIENKSSWPLEGYEWAVGWPMDVESLVDFSCAKDELLPAQQILEIALQRNSWTNECEAGDLCPFHTNRMLLDNVETQEKFLLFLHFYELASGKRWNFRDLFSLVSHVLVGHESAFIVDGQSVRPCVWAAHHAEKVRRSSPDAILSAWLLTARLYTHSLFPVWPNLTSITKSIRELEKANFNLHPNLDKFFSTIANDSDWNSTNIGQLLGKEFCQTLDPANTRRELVLQEEMTIGQVEDAFTTSINRGLELTREYLTEIEFSVLSSLLKADEACDADDALSSLHSSKIKQVQWNLRAMASRLVKRSLGGRAGVCRDQKFLEDYQSLLDGTGDSRKHLRRSFKNLLSNGINEKLTVPLSTTFGQPAHSKQGEVRLFAPFPQSMGIVSPTNNSSRPREQLPYLKLDDVPIPVTFPLFKALSEVRQGLMKASLPEEILALVDGTSNILAGKIVHDKEKLEDSRIDIGGSDQELIFEDGEISEE